MRSRLVFILFVFGALLPAGSVFGQGLQMAFSPASETSVSPGGPVIFSGTLVDTDMDDSALFLNDISVLFTPPADSYLSVDPTGDPISSPNTFFFNTVPGDLIGDGVTGDDTYTGPIFEVYIAPDTPAGIYSGTINILGGYNGPDADFNPLLSVPASFQVVVPEPGVFLLTLAGLAGLATIRKRWA